MTKEMNVIDREPVKVEMRPLDTSWERMKQRMWAAIRAVRAELDDDDDDPDKAGDIMSDPIMQFFAYDHLREDLRMVSIPFASLANHIVETLPRNPERTMALRKLLEAKDSAVRAKLYRDEEELKR